MFGTYTSVVSRDEYVFTKVPQFVCFITVPFIKKVLLGIL